MTDNIFVENRY